MTIQIRPRQFTFISNLAKGIGQVKRAIGCSPTGTGKTVVFLEISARAIAKQKTVLIVTESKKIFSQIASRCSAIEINAKVKNLYVAPNKVYVAMAQTLRRRENIIEQFAALGLELLIIYDECHEGDFNYTLRKIPNSLLIGFTATPAWENAKHLSEFYKACVVSGQVSDWIDEGFLCPYRHYARIGADMDKLRIKSGEFTEESQKAAFETGAVFDGLLEDLKTIPFKKAMVFCSSIAHCEDVYEMLQFNDIKCVRYHSQHQLSEYDLAEFENTQDVNVCVSLYSLQKGYDFPLIDLTALLYKTTSVIRYLQSIGRASRPLLDKKNHICLDYGQNYMRHGLWDMDRPWETLWMPPTAKPKNKKDTLNVYSVKNCPDCMAIIPASTQVCPYCSAILRQEKELQQGELVEITEKYQQLIGRRVSELTPEELAVYARLKNKKAFAIRIAKAQDQAKHGWLEAFSDSMGYSFKWASIVRNQLTQEKIEFADIVLK